MASREFNHEHQSSFFGKLIKGNEALGTMQFMGFEQLRRLFICFVVIVVTPWCIGVAYGLDSRERANMFAYEWKKMAIDVLGASLPSAYNEPFITATDVTGTHHTINLYLLDATPWIRDELLYSEAILDIYAAAGFGLGVWFLTFMLGYGFYIGEGMSGSKPLRGTSIVSGIKLAKLIEKDSKERARQRNFSDPKTYSVGGIPIPLGDEGKHIMLVGSTGTGKTQLIQDLIAQVRRRGGKAIVYDSLQTFVGHFYDPDIDIILDPFDDRTAAWTPFLEAEDGAEWRLIAKALISSKDKDDYWVLAARSVLASVAEARALNKADWSTGGLVDYFMQGSNEAIAKQVSQTSASLHIPTDAPKQAAAVKATIAEALLSLSYVKDGQQPFSIKDWVRDDTRQGILWISTENSKAEATRPLITTWLDIALWSLQGCDRSKERLMWFILDELQSLQCLPSLEAGLTQARGYGGAYVLGFHNNAQMDAIYTKDVARSILANCRSTIACSTSDPETQDYISRRLGEQEIEEFSETHSMGTNVARDGMSVQKRREEIRLVTPTQIGRLKDMTGYVKMAGDYPLALIQWPFIKRTLRHPHKVPRSRPDAPRPIDPHNNDQSIIETLELEVKEASKTVAAAAADIKSAQTKNQQSTNSGPSNPASESSTELDQTYLELNEMIRDAKAKGDVGKVRQLKVRLAKIENQITQRQYEDPRLFSNIAPEVSLFAPRRQNEAEQSNTGSEPDDGPDLEIEAGPNAADTAKEAALELEKELSLDRVMEGSEERERAKDQAQDRTLLTLEAQRNLDLQHSGQLGQKPPSREQALEEGYAPSKPDSLYKPRRQLSLSQRREPSYERGFGRNSDDDDGRGR